MLVASTGLPLPEVKAQMLGRQLLFAVLIWQGFAACGRGAPETAPPRQPAEEATETSAESPPARGVAARLVGDWELRRDPPQRMPGINLTVTVDSISGARYFGRLSHYFSGNVGIDPRDFEPFADSIGSDKTVVFAMPTFDREMLGIVMEGIVAGDTIQLGKFVLGPDTLSAGTWHWVLVRRS